MGITEVGIRLAAAPTVLEEQRPHTERAAALELSHRHPGIRDITYHWETVADGDIVAEDFPGLVGWHFLTATGLVNDDCSNADG